MAPAVESSFDIPAPMAFALSEREPMLVLDQTYHSRAVPPLFDMHYPLELGIMLDGRARRYFSGAQFDCGPGDVWTCGMWEPHGFLIRAVPCRVVVLVIWPPLLANLHDPECPGLSWMAPFSGDPVRRSAVSERSRDRVLALGRQILEWAGGDDPMARMRRRLRLMDLLLLLMEGTSVPGREEGMTPSENYRRITPAIDLVFQAHGLIANEDAAHACAMSTSVFIRAFRASMGLSFTKFALRRRLEQAAAELRQTVDPVKAIAQRWGFTDASHLHRLFQAHYGSTPANYRRRLRGLSPFESGLSFHGPRHGNPESDSS